MEVLIVMEQRSGFTAEFGAKRVYPSEQGLHIECYTEAQAQAAYADATSKGISNIELDGLVLIWKPPAQKYRRTR